FTSTVVQAVPQNLYGAAMSVGLASHMPAPLGRLRYIEEEAYSAGTGHIDLFPSLLYTFIRRFFH
ncbi:MAG: hypothetical protein LBH43_13000, partial [Treponema sp.]|nr:hypothetical protein [Treponema sp.]